MRSMMIIGMSIAVIAASGAAPTKAQDLVKDPVEIGFCVCEHQTLTALLDTLHQRQQSYDSSRQALATLDQELATRRSQMNVYDAGQIDAYKQLLQRRDHAAAVLSDDITPDYNAIVARYNAAFSNYNARCAGKSFDQTVYNRVEATLSCPKP